MILGDGLLVMVSLAEREALRGKVQCIYFDPPYGIKFNSNWQPSTKSRDVKDGKEESVSREPEVVRAFRDTWKDEIHSYLSYLRDRLMVARDVMSETGSIFVQIWDENVHVVRSVMDEVFNKNNFVSLITAAKTSGATSDYLSGVADYILFYAKDREQLKYRNLFRLKELGGDAGDAYTYVQTVDGRRISISRATQDDLQTGRPFRLSDLRSSRPPGSFPVLFEGSSFVPKKGYWKTGEKAYPPASGEINIW